MLKIIVLLLFCALTFNAQIFAQTEMKRISVELNAAGELLITKSNGEKSGFDAVSKKTINRIKGLTISEAVDHYPTYTAPIGGADKNLMVTVYGTKTPQAIWELPATVLSRAFPASNSARVKS